MLLQVAPPSLFSHSQKVLAALPVLWYKYGKMEPEAKGPLAARLRQRKFAHLRSLEIPPDALPGSLALSYTRCGKPNCRCARGKEKGHPGWQLTFMVDGKKRVERVPREWAEEVLRRVEEGRAFRDAVAEIFTANAELLVLSRRQRSRARR